MRPDSVSLSSAVLTSLLLDVEPSPPAADVASRMLRRVRARLEEAKSIVTVRRDAGWKPLFPGAERKVVHDDGTTQSWLLKLAPGVRLPKHRHEHGAEECIVLEGDMWHQGERYGPGDYIVAPEGSVHEETYTETGALLFFRTPSARRPNAQAD